MRCTVYDLRTINSINPTLVNNTVSYLSWLERYTDNVEVGSSTLPGTTKKTWGVAQLVPRKARGSSSQRLGTRAVRFKSDSSSVHGRERRKKLFFLKYCLFVRAVCALI